MTPVAKYTLARFGLLGAVFLAFLPVPELSLLVKALLALVVTMPLSWFLLRRWRDEMAANLTEAAARRRVRNQALRDALADGGENDQT